VPESPQISTAPSDRIAPDAPISRRDPRLDLLRGLCVARMILVHFGWNSEWIRWPFGLITAAEGFFLISGVTLGKVGWRYAETGRASELTRRLLLRAGWLWLANTALVLLYRKLTGTCASPPGVLADFWRDTPRWQQILSFDQPAGLQVLSRYVVFLLLTPFVLAALRKGWKLPLVAASIALWAAHIAHPRLFLLPFFESESAAFPLAAWQLLLVVGIAIGYRGEAGAPTRSRIAAVGLAAAFLLAALFVLLQQLGMERLAASYPDELYRFFGREILGPARLLNLAALAAVLWFLVTRFLAPLRRLSGWLLEPLGRQALAAYLLHVPAAWALFCVRGGDVPGAVGTALAWISLLAISGLVRISWLRRLLAPV
jgi:hypothetical protein